jgi:hypothetical protein
MSITTLKPQVTNNRATQHQFWKEHTVKQKESGLSRAAYCRKHQLNYDHFNYWFRKEKGGVQQLVPVKLNQPAHPVPFGNKTVPILCSLALKNGCVLQIHDKGILSLILSTLN